MNICYKTHFYHSPKGGVWYCNQYPGARCDVWSSLYQYSFYQNPSWTSAMAPAGEIHKYIKVIMVGCDNFHVYNKARNSRNF